MANNRQIYIRYEDNQPVKVETHYVGEQERRRPLSDVADLIGAFKTAVAPRFDSTPTDELTLHNFVNGVESPALRPGLALADLTGGKTDDDPLIIKSKNHQESPAVVRESSEIPSFKFSEHQLLNTVQAKLQAEYSDTMFVVSEHANDIRRAFSLCRWRCIYLKVALTILEQQPSGDLSNHLSKLEEFRFPVELDSDMEEKAKWVFREKKLEEFFQHQGSFNADVNDEFDAYLFSYFWCKSNLNFFQFSTLSKWEFQFHLLWERILVSTIGLARAKPLKLYPEFAIRKLISGYKCTQFIDFVMFFEDCAHPFAVLFVELGASLISDSDDHKDFQKLISSATIYLSDLYIKLRDRDGIDLTKLRVFGLFITRFAVDFVVIRPIIEDNDHTKVVFIVETDRKQRKHVVQDKSISSSYVERNLLTEEQLHLREDLQKAHESGRDVNPMEFAGDFDLAREIRHEDNALDIDHSSTDKNVLRQDSLQKKIADQLVTMDLDRLKPLFAFGVLIRDYVGTVKSWFNSNLDNVQRGKAADLLPRPLSSRKSSSARTPAKDLPPSKRPRQSDRIQERSKESLEELCQVRNTEVLHGSVEVLYESEGVEVLSFQVSGSDTVHVLKYSVRASGRHEIEMIRRLDNYQFVPYVYFSDFNENRSESLVVTEQLHEVNPNIGRSILSRFNDHLHFMRDAIQALQYLHSMCVLHRDISSTNIMYSTRDGRYKLLDFESSQVLEISKADGQFVDDVVIGTKPFIDPKVIETKTYSIYSDWYSLGHVCIQRLVYDLGLEIDHYQQIPPIMEFFNRISNVAREMVRLRETSLQPEQLLDLIQSICCKIQRYQDKRNSPAVVHHDRAVAVN